MITTYWHNILQRTDPEKFMRLITAESKTPDYFGVRAAMCAGREKSITAYAKLFKLVLPDRRANLLIKITNNGLRFAMKAGSHGSIVAYQDLLELVPPHARANVLCKICGTGLMTALQENRSESVEAFGEILKLVPVGERADLLATLTDSGVRLAFEKSDLVSQKAFLKILLNLAQSKAHRALADYVNLIKLLVPADERAVLKDSEDDHKKLLLTLSFSDNLQDANLMYYAYNASSGSDQASLRMLQREFNMHDEFLASKSEFDKQSCSDAGEPI